MKYYGLRLTMLIVQKTLNFGSHFILLLTLSAKAEKLTLQPVKLCSATFILI